MHRNISASIKIKIRLTYEDVIEAVLSDEPEEVLLPEEEELQGLWHKLVWKKAASSFLMRGYHACRAETEPDRK